MRRALSAGRIGLTWTVGAVLWGGLGCAPHPPPASEVDRQQFAIMAQVLRVDSNAVDVGTCEGSHLAVMARLAPKGVHHAFEPLPHLFESLRARFSGPNVRLHQVALSDTAGEADFQFVVDSPGYSGLSRRPWYPEGVGQVRPIRVRTERLDAVLPADLPIALIKIDVEGAELAVLQGAEGTLARWSPVVLFEHGVPGSGRLPATERIYELLVQRHGLQVFLMPDWLKGRAPLSREAFLDTVGRHRVSDFVAARKTNAQ